MAGDAIGPPSLQCLRLQLLCWWGVPCSRAESHAQGTGRHYRAREGAIVFGSPPGIGGTDNPRVLPVLYQSPSPVITPPPSPALSGHRHLPVGPPSPPLPVSPQAPRGPVPLGLQFAVPLARYPHSLFLSLSSFVSELLATPSQRSGKIKGKKFKPAPVFLLFVNTSVGRGLQQRVKCKC